MAAGAVVERHSDHFPDDIPDEGWLQVVGSKGWLVLTNDKRIRHRRIECQALLAAGVRTFVLTTGNLTSASAAEIWVRQLPKIERLAISRPAPFIAHVNRASVRIMPVSRRR